MIARKADELSLEASIHYADAADVLDLTEDVDEVCAILHHDVAHAQCAAAVDAHLAMDKHLPAELSCMLDDHLHIWEVLQDVVVVVVLRLQRVVHPDLWLVAIQRTVVDGLSSAVDDMRDAKPLEIVDVERILDASQVEVVGELGEPGRQVDWFCVEHLLDLTQKAGLLSDTQNFLYCGKRKRKENRI